MENRKLCSTTNGVGGGGVPNQEREGIDKILVETIELLQSQEEKLDLTLGKLSGKADNEGSNPNVNCLFDKVLFLRELSARVNTKQAKLENLLFG